MILFKSIAAGILIGTGALGYMAFYGINNLLGAFLFSFGLIGVCLESLNLVTGKFGAAYNGEYSIIDLIIIFIGNIIGIWIMFMLRRLDARPELMYEIGEQITAIRENRLWY